MARGDGPGGGRGGGSRGGSSGGSSGGNRGGSSNPGGPGPGSASSSDGSGADTGGTGSLGGRPGSSGSSRSTNADGRDTPGSPSAPDGNRGSTMGSDGGRSNAIGNDSVSGESIRGSRLARSNFGSSTNADGRDTPGSRSAPDGRRGASMGVGGGRVGSGGRDSVTGGMIAGGENTEISDAAIEKAVMEKSPQESFTEGVNKYAPEVMKALMPGPLGFLAEAGEMIDGYVNDQSLADSGPHAPGAPEHAVPGIRADGTVAGTPSAGANPGDQNGGGADDGIIKPQMQPRQARPPQRPGFGYGQMTNYGSYKRRVFQNV